MSMPTIFIDGDACPVRDEVYRVAGRLGLPVVVVGNGSRGVRPPPLPNARIVVVGDGADAADDWIAAHIAAGDVCVTADIPLAARCLEKAAKAIAPNGRVWDGDNIGGALASREIGRVLREAGVATGGPPPLDKAARSRFLSALDAAVQGVLRAGRGG